MPKIIENENQKTVPISISLKKNTVSRLDKKIKAMKPKVSRSALVEYLVEKYLVK